ncbi:hypothetical protein ACFYXF_08715 [Streptomyces sp. NPDC002680]|uniref:hypothetical protein n=1 Tax=Streptomyces sp. NPDC002680 TaxID=3364659 RepID=UPI0036BE96B7
MPADEVTHGTDVDGSRGRTGPRHAAPRKPLFTRFHVPAGKAIALAAMPTAVLMGMGFTPTLANADDQPTTNSQKAEEYKACVAAMEDDASASATPSETSSESSSDETTATPSASATDSESGDDSASGDSSSDSGSDDEATPTPTPSASKTTSSGSTGGDSDTATPTPSASASATEESGGLLETIGDAIVDIFTGGSDSSSDTTSTTTSTESTETTEPAATATPTPTASAAPTTEAADKDTTDTTTVKDTTPKVTEVLKDATDTAAKPTETTTEAAEEAADEATASATPSASATTDVDDCPVATEDLGGVDNTIRLPDDPWTLEASSLLLKGADYQGIVKVRTADGTVKEVLKYVISDGTDIGDLHQLVSDDTSGKTYHVQAAKGSTSTIKDGKTIMYTESISGNLFGLIPVTFSPKSPPPLNIPLIYFTNVKVTQAGQFGGTLTVPGLHQYTT